MSRAILAWCGVVLAALVLASWAWRDRHSRRANVYLSERAQDALVSGPASDESVAASRSEVTPATAEGVVLVKVSEMPASFQTVEVLDPEGELLERVVCDGDGLAVFSLHTAPPELAIRATFLRSRPELRSLRLLEAAHVTYEDVDFGAVTTGVRIDLLCSESAPPVETHIGLRGVAGGSPTGALAQSEPFGHPQGSPVFVEFPEGAPYRLFLSSGASTFNLGEFEALSDGWRAHQADLCGLCLAKPRLSFLPEIAQAGQVVMVGSGSEGHSAPLRPHVTGPGGITSISIWPDKHAGQTASMATDDGELVPLLGPAGRHELECGEFQVTPSIPVVALALAKYGQVILDRPFSLRGLAPRSDLALEMEEGVRVVVRDRFLEHSEVGLQVLGVGSIRLDPRRMQEAVPGLVLFELDGLSDSGQIKLIAESNSTSDSSLSVRLRTLSGDFIAQEPPRLVDDQVSWLFDGIGPGSYQLGWTWARTTDAERIFIPDLTLEQGASVTRVVAPPELGRLEGQILRWSQLPTWLRPSRVSIEGVSSSVSPLGGFEVSAVIPLVPYASAQFPSRTPPVPRALALKLDPSTSAILATVEEHMMDRIGVVLQGYDATRPMRVEYWPVSRSGRTELRTGWGASTFPDENGRLRIPAHKDETVVGCVWAQSGGPGGRLMAVFTTQVGSADDLRVELGGRELHVEATAELAQDSLEVQLRAEPVPNVTLTHEIGRVVPSQGPVIWCPNGITEVVLRSGTGEVRRFPTRDAEIIAW